MRRFVASSLLASAVIAGLFAGAGQAAALTADHLSAPHALATKTVTKVGWHHRHHHRRRCWWRHHCRRCHYWY